MSRKKKKNTGEKADFLGVIWEQGAEIYLFIMLAVFPLFMGRGYGELIYRKWALFLYASSAFVIISAVGGLAVFVRKRKAAAGQKDAGKGTVIGRRDAEEKVAARRRNEGKDAASGQWNAGKNVAAGQKGNAGKFWDGWIVTDWFVLVYLPSVLLSFIGAVDRRVAFWGLDTWYMGLVSQVLFVGIYFGVSRGYKESRYLEVLAAAVGLIVDGIVVLQRFGVDVANLYQGYNDEVKMLFVTTQGQITWTSSYTNILLVAGMGIYYLAEEKREKIFLGCCIGIGFGTAILLNCDSGMIAVLAAWMVMLWLALGSKKRLLALAEIVMIALGATAVVGIFERIFAGRISPIDAVYLKVPQSWMVYVLLAAVGSFYWLVKKDRVQGDAKERTIRILRGIYVLFLCLGIVGMAVLFILHGKGYFAGSPTGNYFLFDTEWGKGRGFIWRVGAAVFADYNLWRKLFGCGPDCFTAYSYGLMGDAMTNFWPTLTIPNVHNEWFNGVVNLGIVGGIAYLGIFVSAAYRLLKSALDGDCAVMFGMGLAVVGYMAHNTFCYQQITGTSLIFIFLGIGVAKVREGYTSSLFRK